MKNDSMRPCFEIEENLPDAPALLPGTVPLISPDAEMPMVVEAFLTSQIPNKKTARGYRRHITAAIEMMGVERFRDLEPLHLMNYRSELMADKRGTATHAQALIAVRSFLVWGAALKGHCLSMDQAKFLLKVPKVHVITPQEPDLSNEQVDALFEQAFRARGSERESLRLRLSECSPDDVFNAAHRNFERYGNEDRLDFPKQIFHDYTPITYDI